MQAPAVPRCIGLERNFPDHDRRCGSRCEYKLIDLHTVLDAFVRNHTVDSFGPVRQVEPKLVFEVAFDSVHRSARHKSGVAMRFPRIHRTLVNKYWVDEGYDATVVKGTWGLARWCRVSR